ncbi:glucose-1-phosphatase-like [Plodia interpunctella]|uniref:glucose-1-phosphatase-like n=1 Tax=Plodia interpunctella TaxID=58824 RepID=UPI002368422C|nr:glucose-1-phosphatase-like [Plodia interpunctella]
MNFKLLFLILYTSHNVKSMTLDQVILLSRHNVRTPLSKYLTEMTPNEWPKWKEKSGYLTEKGFELEGFMGKYFSMRFQREGLISSCPTEDDFFAYANTKQRTRMSALAFVSQCYPGCNVTIHHSNTTVDPIFNPVIHNNSDVFRDIVIEQMTDRLKCLNLNKSFDYMESVLDFKHSSICTEERECDLKSDSNKIVDIKRGFKPNLSGPLKISNSAIDAFIMGNYEGFQQIAWGKLRTEEQWITIMKLSRAYHNVIFNTTIVADDIARPLIRYISSIVQKGHPKISLLMGHDANIYTIHRALNFKSYNLRNQHELIPVGGKIMFEKWFDVKNDRYLLRINYVYQSTEQLRSATELSLHNPPHFHLMELENCQTDKNGYCLWEDFETILHNLSFN